MVPLHVHSNFSLLRGASTVEDLVSRAATLGYSAIALTDRDALYGAPRLIKACAAHGLRPIVGAEITLESNTHLTLLAEDQTGYANLCRIISRAHQDHPKGEASLSIADLTRYAAGIIALSGPRTGEIPRLLLAHRRFEASRAAECYQDIFGDHFYLEIQNHLLPDDGWLMAELAELGKARHIELVATTDIHYAQTERRMLQDILTTIRTKTTLAAPSSERLPNGHFGLKPPTELQQLFRQFPAALARTDDIAQRCAVSLDFRHARFPPLNDTSHRDGDISFRPGEQPDDALKRLCFEGLRRRYRPVTSAAQQQLLHELAIVREAALAPFFLIAADIARRFHGRCRGSAAGSLIVYCLGVSAVDPLRYGMLFERFINPERPTLPDIDIDFSEWDREAAIAYVYRTYGADHAAMVCNYVRYRARLAVRDIGQALGMPGDLLGRLAKSLDHSASGEELVEGIAGFSRKLTSAPSAPRTPSEDPSSEDPSSESTYQWPLLIRFCQEIDDFPRHLSVHVGGMLVTGRPLVELFGLEPARKEGIVVVGADKEDVEDVGLGKIDLLCLRALSVVQEAEALLRKQGIPFDLQQINLEDPEVYRMLQQADTVGASQVESRAQMQSVVRTRPRCFRDLINQCAIIRPGPIVAGMVHPYNRRRLGLEPVTYPHPLLETITRDTLGIFLFQEQIILGVMALTGCTAGEADVFRRAMGSHRSREAMRSLEPWFLERSQAHGIALNTAREVFRQISGFADFGFCRSHSAALARTAYEGLYLKRYHPAAFYAALINNQPMGFYPVEVLIWDGRRHQVQFLPVDINQSVARCHLDSGSNAIRLGFEQVRGVGRDIAAAIVAERKHRGAYQTLRDFCARTGIIGKPTEGLILAGAFDFTEQSRSALLWNLYQLAGPTQQVEMTLPEPSVDLPERSEHEQTLLDHAVLGFSLERHLVDNYRRRLRGLGVIPSYQLDRAPDKANVRIGGLIVCRQRPATAKGFVFLTLEDRHGLMNVVVRPDIYRQYRDALRDGLLIAVAGRVQRAYGTVNVVAARALTLDPSIPDGTQSFGSEALAKPAAVASFRSHDFH